MESVSSSEKKLRVFFLPFFASGHMIPIADLAALLASRSDVEPTLCLTPANADSLRPSLHPSVRVLLYPFPSEQCGLRPGQENISSVSADEEWKIYKAEELCRPDHERILRDHAPDALVADIPFWWTTDIANRLGIPKITWFAVGVFPQTVMNLLHKQGRDDDAVTVTVKGLPGPPIVIPRSELPEFLRSHDHVAEGWGRMAKAMMDGYGTVVNSCYDLEPDYCDHYRKVDCRGGWFVGPVALSRGSIINSDIDSAAAAKAECLRWLDGQRERSVVFVCFGSWCRFLDEQLAEMAAGLEQSGHPFLWVVRGEGNAETWTPDGWEERVGRRGLVVRGWAP